LKEKQVLLGTSLNILSNLHSLAFIQNSTFFFKSQLKSINSQGILERPDLDLSAGSMLFIVHPLYTYRLFLHVIPAIECPEDV
jgi:hypothetical protein